MKERKFFIDYVKFNNEYLIQVFEKPPHGGRVITTQNFKINGQELVHTFHNNWFSSKEMPTSISYRKVVKNSNFRFVLKDKISSSDFQKEYKREDVQYYSDYEWVWKDEFSHLSSLYTLTSDKHDPIYEECAFEINQSFKLESNIDVCKPEGFSYKVQRSEWVRDGFITTTQNNVQYQLLDKILFPQPLLTLRPCKLTSKQTYDVVRQHIKDNINSKNSEITSDYNFCFAVSKKIKIKPLHKSREILRKNGKPFATPKFKNWTEEFKTKIIFEMTSAADSYGKYPIIKGFQGENAEDLKLQIEVYLKELMRVINEPVSECEHCNGFGRIWEEFDDTIKQP